MTGSFDAAAGIYGYVAVIADLESRSQCRYF
jgi:hypothetical protein